MKYRNTIRRWHYVVIAILLLIVAFFLWQELKVPPTTGNWQDKVAVLSTAEFKDNLVTVRNVRNFKYPDGTEGDPAISYYDKTYDLNKLSKVWYITEPFKTGSYIAHTFLSFEFTDGNYLGITIEARLTKDQKYDIFSGILHTYPLIYIATDERDVILLRANVRGSDVFLYPVRTTPERARLLLVDMLNKMNDIAVKPEWYNSLTVNCTSMIAYHINRLFPGRLPKLLWQESLTGYADALALKRGLLDTDLSLEEARKKYYISDISREIGHTENYSEIIRQFK